MLQLTHVTTKIGAYRAIRDVSLSIGRGGVVALLGGNGAGKSTLFRTIAGLLAPMEGTIAFKGETISGLPAYKVVSRGLCLCRSSVISFPN